MNIQHLNNQYKNGLNKYRKDNQFVNIQREDINNTDKHIFSQSNI